MVPLLIVALIAAAIIMAMRNLNSPAVGTVTTPGAKPATGSAQPASSTDKSYSDKSITFEYPANFYVAAPQSNSGFIDIAKLISARRHDQFASISLFEGSINDNPGVTYRRQSPRLYRMVSDTPDSIVFAKTDGSEYTGFLQRGKYEASVSFTSDSPIDLSQDYKLVANSLQLKI